MHKAAKLFTTTSGIMGAIALIKARGAKLDEAIQIADLSILAHVDQHGDTTLADTLYHAMPRGARRNALVEHMITFGKLRVLSGDADKAAIKAGRIFGYDKERVTDMDGAEAKPWFECKKESAPSTVFDVQAEFLRFMARVQAAQSKGLQIDNPEMLDALDSVALACASK